ncbi:ComEC/Rec2 family competence protein [Microbacterium sp. G2-8]|uniref:ComEC/Rec2 family competence protein n=1 Tax=Microbacterium sp. G2-8 TaxID=2842454 RepID=UPI001C8A4FB2|nr:ComEC/Rec2 family competence protein [Microbacterium sp. G2-8]
MTRRDLRLLPVALTSWAAALASVLLPSAAGGIAVGAWACASIVLAIAIRVRSARIALAVVVLASAGIPASHVASAVPEREAVVEALGRAVSDAEVRIASKVEPGAGMLRFSGVVKTARGSEPVTVMWPEGERSAGLDLGATVEVDGRVAPARAGEASVALLRATDVRVREGPGHVLALSSALRRGFVEDVARGLPEPGAGLLPGLSVGETSGVGDELDAAMTASSLSHLTAVSGSNCALVVGIAFGLAALCGARRGVRIGVAVVALAGFVVLVTPEASVIRAASMAAIAMLALLLGRAGAGVAVLSLAVTVLMATDPWLAASYGFLLSAGATGALLLLAAPLARGLARWMPRALALGIAVPLAAQLVCGPIIVLFAPEVALYGVFANMIAGPAAPAATVLGLLACLAQPIPPLALGAAALAWLPSAWVAQTATTFAAFPAASMEWQEGWAGFLALTALGASAAAAIVPLPARRVPTLVRRLSVAALAVVMGMGVGTVALRTAVGPLTAPRDWQIAVCDVGQGDAILVRSEGSTALVDTGPDPDALDTCLTRLGVDEIDLAILTHFDADHAGGLSALAGRARTILHGPAETEGELASVLGIGAETVREGHSGMHGTLGSASWRIIWPAPKTRAFPPGNDTSLVVEIAGGGIPRTLLLGDLSESAQRLLVARSDLGDVDVVKVSHHGSRDQLPALYLAIDPEIALIGVGENDYGHPHPDLLATLAQTGAAVGRTDADGLVLVGADDGLTLWRER